MNKNKKGFTLIELLASIGVLVVIILMATISYAQIRKNILNSQYNNLKHLIEQTGVKFSSKTGYRNFFVQDLIDNGMLETDDEKNIYDPRDKSVLNCHIVTVTEDENGNLSGLLHKEEHVENGKCKTSDIDNYKGSLTISATIKDKTLEYPGTSETPNPNSIFPYITLDGWTNTQLTISAHLDDKVSEAEKNGGRFVWNKDSNVVTEYPNSTMHTSLTGVVNEKYFVDFYTSTGDAYEANMGIKFDLESPVIFKEESNKPRLASGSSNTKWSRSKTVIVYATDKDGVGLQRIYIGKSACSNMRTNANLGQPTVPGMIQTVTVYDNVGTTPENYHICAIDRLGNLVDGGTIPIAMIDNTAPEIQEKVFVYNSTFGLDEARYTNPIATLTDSNIDIANYHPDGWTATGHFYLFKINDVSSTSTSDFKITVNYTPEDGTYKDNIPYSNKATRTLSSDYTFHDAFTGMGKRKIRYEICDKLSNCKTVSITNDNVDKTAPVQPTMNYLIKGTDGQVYDGNWINKTIIAARSTTSAAPTTTDKGSGVAKCQISEDKQTWYDYSYDVNNRLYVMSTEGIHNRYFRCIDRVGNIGSTKGIPAKIDLTKPIVRAYANKRDTTKTNNLGDILETERIFTTDGTLNIRSLAWSSFGIVIGAKGEDSLSGVKKKVYNWDESYSVNEPTSLTGNSDVTSTSGTNFINLTGEGFRVVKYTVTDNAGNSTAVTFKMKIDTSKPTNIGYKFRKNDKNGVELPNSTDWTNNTVWWGNFTANDTYSGVKEYEYASASICNSDENDASGLLDPNGHTYGAGDGRWCSEGCSVDFCIRAVDYAGNKSAWKKNIYVRVDKTKPTTPEMNFVFSGWDAYTGGWTSANLYAARKSGEAAPYSTDTLSGIKQYEISKDGSSWTTYSYSSSAEMYKMSTTGTHVRYFRAKDNAGNYSPVKTVYGYIDKDAPTNVKYKLRKNDKNGVELSNSSSWTNNTVWWGEFSATDPHSGVSKFEYGSGDMCENNQVQASGNLSSGGHTYGQAGANYCATGCDVKFCMRAVDAVGNKSNWLKYIYIRVDKVAPTCTNSGDSTTWQKANRTIYYGCSDTNGSGCTSSSNGSKTIDYTAKTETIGTYGITDNAGNYTPCSSRTANVYVDKKAPDFVVKNGSTDITSNSSATVSIGTKLTLKCTDAHSGTSSRTLKVDENTITSGYDSSTYTYTLTGGTSPLTQGTSHSVSLTCSDSVGNSATKTYSISVPSSGSGTCGYISGSSCSPIKNSFNHPQNVTCCSSSPKHNYTYIGEITKRLEWFGCSNEKEDWHDDPKDGSFTTSVSNWNSAFRKGVSCTYINGTGHYSCTTPTRQKFTDLSIDHYFSHYKCTSGGTASCGTDCQYATGCTYDENNLYTYIQEGSRVYRIKCGSYRSGNEYSNLRKNYTDSGQGDYQVVCCN